MVILISSYKLSLLTWCNKRLRRCHAAAHIYCLGLSTLWFLPSICGDHRETTLPCDAPWVGGTLARGLDKWSRLDGDRSLLKAQGLQASGLRGGCRPLMTAKGKILDLECTIKEWLILRLELDTDNEIATYSHGQNCCQPWIFSRKSSISHRKLLH